MAKIGSQIPSISVVQPYEKTYGQEAIDLYRLTGREEREWQKIMMFDIMAYNEDGLWIHSRFGYSVPRRNGKNEILAMRELIALKKGEKVMHTAHRQSTSHAAWERLCELLDNAGIKYNSIRASGKENVRIKDGGRVEFRTRSSKGGLGEGYDVLIIDEAQEYTNDQESALKYVVTDSKNPQTLMCGTPPTPVSSGTVFMEYRNDMIQGGKDNAGWAEWSVENMTDPYDREAWYKANPSLGIQLTERAIADEIGSDEVDFNIQRLGLWLRYNQKSAISENEWKELKADKLPKLKGRLFVGVKYGHDGQNVAMSIAVKTASGKIFIEGIDCRPAKAGTDWIVAFIKNADVQKIVVDGQSGQEILAAAMKDAAAGVPVLPTVKQIIAANAYFEQGIAQQNICHLGQPAMHKVATNCQKRAIGSNGGFGYKSIQEDCEIALLDSAIFAFWACLEGKEKRKQRTSY